MTLLTKLPKFQTIHHKLIQRQLQMSMIKKYLKKDIYLQKKDKKLLMSWNQNKIKVSKNSQKINSETFTNENDKEIPKEIPKKRYISPEERQKIIDDLRSIMIV